MIQARDGRLYATTSFGPPLGPFFSGGSVFSVEADGTAATVLHRFDSIDMVVPVAELVEIDDGSVYGTAARFNRSVNPPPALGGGTIFRVDPATASFTTRYRFSGPDGSDPVAPLIQGTDGLIYGTTLSGGAFGLGTVFSLDSADTLTTLHHFAGADGANPNAGVLQGLDGRLYGTTTNGGAFGYGTVFVMNVTGGLTTLHDFALNDGASPVNELIQANDGAFYGAAPIGGPTGGGVIFRVRLATSPPDQYVEIVSRHSGQCLDVYGGSTDAAASVIQWPCHGGPNQQWRLEPAGGGAFRIVARHSGQALDVYGGLVDDVTPIIQWPEHGGDNQVWTLEPAPDGYLRIVARHSGKAMDVEYASADDGARVIQVHASRRRESAVASPTSGVDNIMTTAFLTHRPVRLALVAVALALVVTTTVNAQHAATYEVVSSFDIGFKIGSRPSSLRQADDGTFYGTASAGGLFDKGTLFRMDATGGVTLLHSFSGSNDGEQPFGLVRASDGRFYGMTQGELSRIRNSIPLHARRWVDDAACVFGDREITGFVCGERWERLWADVGRRRFRERHDLRDRSQRQRHHHP